MNANFLTYLTLSPAILLIVLLFFIGWYKAKRVATEDQYLLANRNVGLWILTASLVTPNLATLIAFSAAGYYASWWAISLPFVFFIGITFYAITVAKHWKDFNGASVAEYFSQRYGKDMGVLVAIILLLAMLGFSATYVKSLSIVFGPLFPQLNAWQVSGIGVACIVLVSLRGGLKAIIHTDAFNLILIFIFFPLLIYYARQIPIQHIPKPINFATMTTHLPIRYVVSLMLLTMFSYILAPWYGQKMVAAKDRKTAYYAVLIAAFLVFILYSLGVIIVITLQQKGILFANPETALAYLMSHGLPLYMKNIAYAILFIMATTSLASIWNAMVALLMGLNLSKQNHLLQKSILLTLFIAGLSLWCANVLVNHILQKMILANIPIVALSFALLAGFYWKRASRLGVYMSIMVGLMVGVGSYLIYGETGMYTWYWAVYGIPLIFAAGIIGSYL